MLKIMTVLKAQISGNGSAEHLVSVLYFYLVQSVTDFFNDKSELPKGLS